MKRALVGLSLVGGCVAGVVVGGPSGAAALLAREGVSVTGARWCDEGLCFDGVARGGATAEHVVARWDRAVRVHGVTVPLGAAAEAARAGVGGAGAGGLPAWAPGLVTAVDVVDLRVPGTPLPALSGRAWPDRRLVGDGVSIEGDAVRATVPTPLGELVVEATRGPAGIEVVARCAACVIPAPSDADAPLPLPAVVARGTWAEGAFTGRVRIEDVEAGVEARPDGDGAVAELTLPVTPVASLYGLFAPWVPEARRARIGGTVHATARVRWSGQGGEGSGEGGLAIEALDPAVEGFTVDGLVPDTLAGGPFQFRGRDPAGADHLFTRGEGTPEWVSLSEVGAWLPAAVIAAEDGAFRAHAGYDLAGMREAAAANAAEGDVVRGGSTLTQQLAKNLFLDGTRSYARKLRELLYAVEMERELGKHRILELYLNVVEFGPGLRGARAAADTYFLKAPAGLLPEEAAWLASILRSPSTAWRRQYMGGSVDAGRVRWILENMRGVPEEPRAAALDRAVRLVPPG